MYLSRIVLSVGDSVWYMVRNLCCTATINLVLANSKTQNAFLFPVHTMFCHDGLLAVKPASTRRRQVHKKKLERFSTCWYAPLRRDHPGYCKAEVGNPGGTFYQTLRKNDMINVSFNRQELSIKARLLHIHTSDNAKNQTLVFQTTIYLNSGTSKLLNM
jgi:hypothetical protein